MNCLKNNKSKIGVLYIVTNSYRKKQSEFKLGKHTGTQNALESRYRTYLGDPVVLRFIKCPNYSYHELELLTIFDKHRIINNKGNQSEWLKISEKELLKTFDDYVNKIDYGNKKNINWIMYMNILIYCLFIMSLCCNYYTFTKYNNCIMRDYVDIGLFKQFINYMT